MDRRDGSHHRGRLPPRHRARHVEAPDLVVHNAFGEPYPYALCPQNIEVREYARTLVHETLLVTECSGLVLGAYGPMGLQHDGVHDKAGFARFTPSDDTLLSLCFCLAGRSALNERGLDADEVASRVRAAIGTASSPEAALGEFAEAVAAQRVAASVTLRDDLVEVVREAKTRALLTWGATELHLYHLGLLNADGVALASRLSDALRNSESDSTT